jgi:hypothetical protein
MSEFDVLTPGEGDLLEIERRQPSSGLGNCRRLEVVCGAWACLAWCSCCRLHHASGCLPTTGMRHAWLAWGTLFLATG